MTSLFTTIWTLIAGVIVLFLPGLAWQALFRDAEQDLFERLAEVMGISISVTALFALLAYLLNWSFTSPVLILGYILLVPPAIWMLRQWWREKRK